MKIRLEWKIEDMWIGVFWRVGPGRVDLWVCLIPCFPVHVSWARTGETMSGRPRVIPDECPGKERGGTGDPCCDRAGEYNGFGSDGPLEFICEKGCSCHD